MNNHDYEIMIIYIFSAIVLVTIGIVGIYKCKNREELETAILFILCGITL